MTDHDTAPEPDRAALAAYLPADRWRALAQDAGLPERAEGAVLFADISGFTPLSEALARTLGPRAGAEALSAQINRVYAALIAQVTQWGGVVMSFAGDAVTCWFDAAHAREGEVLLDALACALAMQAALREMGRVTVRAGESVTLGLKIAVAAGATRRFVVGDVAVQWLDVLTGAPLARVAALEQGARRGEIVLDAETAAQNEAALELDGTRVEKALGARVALVRGLRVPRVPPAAQAESAYPEAERMRPWLLPAVYARLAAGAGDFLTELRPAVALFVRFAGIDYVQDAAAGAQLDAFVRWVQGVLTRYGGALLQVVTGDKGDYLYAAFGAPEAHEDAASRAARAALELRTLPPACAGMRAPQIGLARGLLRAGAYGASTRRTYGVLGDAVNVAARLMQAAPAGQIWLEASFAHALGADFESEALPPVRLKGKQSALAVRVLRGAQWANARRAAADYALPLIGRGDELIMLEARLAQAERGHGQVVAVVGEAGLGKSRLVAEFHARTVARGVALYSGACLSYGVRTPYLLWREVWRTFFGVAGSGTHAEQVTRLERALAALDPAFVARAPLLGVALDLPVPDNALTRTLDASMRKASLEALLVDCLKHLRAPAVFVLEDLHWLDPLSRDLLDTLGRVSDTLPVCFVLAYRPPEAGMRPLPRANGWAHFSEIMLNELPAREAEHMIEARWARTGVPAPRGLKQRILERAQGNPFYIEELINDLQERANEWRDADALDAVAWPDSLHQLILSRIDRLAEREKITLKVASVIGRVFSLAWLHGYYPALGSAEQIKSDLEKLRGLELTPLNTPEPELSYLFKHIVTQEVAYESLSSDTRAALHALLARYLEAVLPQSPPLDLLAYHYERSGDPDKAREYLRRAGAAAQAVYANAAARDYYERWLPLLAAPEWAATRVDALHQLGLVLERLGQWDAAEARYVAALALAEELGDVAAQARVIHTLGGLARQRGRYDDALRWLTRAREAREALGDLRALGATLAELGAVHERRGEYALAQPYLEAALAHARAQNDVRGIAQALTYLGAVARSRGDIASARAYYSENLTLARTQGDTWALAIALNIMGGVALAAGDSVGAEAQYRESLALKRELGDKWGIAISLNSLGWIAYSRGALSAAEALYRESLGLKRELGDPWGEAISLNNLGWVLYAEGRRDEARAHFEQSLALDRVMGDRRGIVICLFNLGVVALDDGRQEAARAHFGESLSLARTIGAQQGVVCGLVGLAALLAAVPDIPGIPGTAGDAAAGDAAAGDAKMARAARWLAAAEGLRARLKVTLDIEAGRLLVRARAAVAAALSAEAYAAACAAGEAAGAEVCAAEALAG